MVTLDFHCYTWTFSSSSEQGNPMDREAWQVIVTGSQRVGHNLAIKQQYCYSIFSPDVLSVMSVLFVKTKYPFLLHSNVIRLHDILTFISGCSFGSLICLVYTSTILARVVLYILFHYGLSHCMQYNSLCYTLGPCFFSILSVIFYICHPQTLSPSLCLHSSLLATTLLFSVSISLFCSWFI